MDTPPNRHGGPSTGWAHLRPSAGAICATTREFLTNYTDEWGNKVVNKAWKLGDFIWTKYDEKF